MVHIAAHLYAEIILVVEDEINVPIALSAFRDKNHSGGDSVGVDI